MKPIHVGRRNKSGVRKLWTWASKDFVASRKNVLGELLEDWCPDERGNMVMGWFWVMLDGDFGKTFPRMRQAVADFERERAERRAGSGKSLITKDHLPEVGNMEKRNEKAR